MRNLDRLSRTRIQTPHSRPRGDFSHFLRLQISVRIPKMSKLAPHATWESVCLDQWNAFEGDVHARQISMQPQGLACSSAYYRHLIPGTFNPDYESIRFPRALPIIWAELKILHGLLNSYMGIQHTIHPNPYRNKRHMMGYQDYLIPNAVWQVRHGSIYWRLLPFEGGFCRG